MYVFIIDAANNLIIIITFNFKTWIIYMDYSVTSNYIYSPTSIWFFVYLSIRFSFSSISNIFWILHFHSKLLNYPKTKQPSLLNYEYKYESRKFKIVCQSIVFLFKDKIS